MAEFQKRKAPDELAAALAGMGLEPPGETIPSPDPTAGREASAPEPYPDPQDGGDIEG